MTGKPNPVPGLVLGPRDPQETVNSALRRWSQQVSPVLYGAFGSMPNTSTVLPVPAAPSNAYLMQAGHKLVAFTTGYGTALFPHPFPNGILTVQVTLLIGGAAGLSFTLGVDKATTLTTLALDMELPVGTQYTGNADVNILAIGW